MRIWVLKGGYYYMLDRAGILIEQGATVGCERVEGVNDNMAKSHYHTHYELYFLEAGRRHHIMQDSQYETEIGDFMILAPYVMHHSFSEKDVPFRRIVLYFTEDAIHAPELRAMLKDASGLYHPSPKVSSSVHYILEALLREQYDLGPLHDATMENLLNSLLITIMRSVTVSKKPELKSRMSKVIEYIETNYQKDIRLKDIAQEFYLKRVLSLPRIQEIHKPHHCAISEHDPHLKCAAVHYGDGSEFHCHCGKYRLFILNPLQSHI